MKLKRKQKNRKNINVNEDKEKFEIDWFTDQYEKIIEKSLPRKEKSTDEVLEILQENIKYNWISEAKAYKCSAPESVTVNNLKWKGPKIHKCTCPDSDCSYRGDITTERIPCGERQFKLAFCRKLLRIFRKPAPAPTQGFAERLTAVVDVEASYYKDLQRRNISTTQTTVGMEGEFTISDYSHVLNEIPDEAIMKDIDGMLLHVTSYKGDNINSNYTSCSLCSFDKLLNMQELVNMKELNSRITLLKQNMYSSILKIKENISTFSTVSIQYEKDTASNDSSGDITIATPYKGVVIKIKKKPTSNKSQKEAIEVQDSGNENIKAPKESKEIVDLTVQLPETDQKKSVLKINPDKFVDNGEKIQYKSQNLTEALTSKSNMTSVSILIDDMSNQINDLANFPPAIPINTSNNTHKECSISRTHVDIQKNITNSNYPLDKSLSNNVCEELTIHENASDKKNSKRIEINTPKTNIIIKCHKNFMKRKLYGFSLDQLQSIKMKKFTKFSSDDRGMFVIGRKANENGKNVANDVNKSVLCNKTTTEACINIVNLD